MSSKGCHCTRCTRLKIEFFVKTPHLRTASFPWHLYQDNIRRLSLSWHVNRIYKGSVSPLSKPSRHDEMTDTILGWTIDSNFSVSRDETKQRAWQEVLFLSSFHPPCELHIVSWSTDTSRSQKPTNNKGRGGARNNQEGVRAEGNNSNQSSYRNNEKKNNYGHIQNLIKTIGNTQEFNNIRWIFL